MQVQFLAQRGQPEHGGWAAGLDEPVAEGVSAAAMIYQPSVWRIVASGRRSIQ